MASNIKGQSYLHMKSDKYRVHAVMPEVSSYSNLKQNFPETRVTKSLIDRASRNGFYCHLIVEEKTSIIIHESIHHQHLPFLDFLLEVAEDLLPSIRGLASLSQIHIRGEILNNMQSIALDVQKDDHSSVLKD